MEKFAEMLKSYIDSNTLDLYETKDCLTNEIHYLKKISKSVDFAHILTSITRIDYYQNNAKSLKWLKYFPNIIELNCGHNNLDSSSLKSLKYIPNLQILNITYNNIRDLSNLRFATKLVKIYCYNNKIKILSHLSINIEYVRCEYNFITDISLNNLPNLKRFCCENNTLISLHISNCAELTQIECSYNELTKLTLINVPNLENLYCDRNKLLALDLAECRSLTFLTCNRNYLTELNLENLINLKQIDCSYNSLSILNISKCKLLIVLRCDYNKLIELDLQGFTHLTNVICISNNLDTLNVSNCKLLESLFCAENNLKEITGLTSLSELNSLFCYNNQINLLDLSNCCKLRFLNCKKNQISNIKDVCKHLNLILFKYDIVLCYRIYKGVDACYICSDACSDAYSDKIITECGHIFHKNCLLIWFNLKDFCPYCRQLFC